MTAIPPTLACSALDASPDAMLIVDTFSIIWFTNRQVSALFGYAHQDIIGEGIEILMPGLFQGKHLGYGIYGVNNVRMRGLGAASDLVGRRRDGTEFPAQIGWSAIQEAGDTLVAVAIRDVTERKRLETELLLARDAVEAMRKLLKTVLNSGKSAAPDLTSAALFGDHASSSAHHVGRR
jgi:PAS domain S-box-containing protein